MSKHKKSTKYEEDNSQPTEQSANNFNLGSLAGIINSVDITAMVDAINIAGEELESTGNGEYAAESGNTEIIRALRTLINADKVILLQTVIQIYAMSRNRRK